MVVATVKEKRKKANQRTELHLDHGFRSRGQVIDLIQDPRGPAPEMKYAMLGVQILKRHPIKGASLS